VEGIHLEALILLSMTMTDILLGYTLCFVLGLLKKLENIGEVNCLFIDVVEDFNHPETIIFFDPVVLLSKIVFRLGGIKDMGEELVEH